MTRSDENRLIKNIQILDIEKIKKFSESSTENTQIEAWKLIMQSFIFHTMIHKMQSNDHVNPNKNLKLN